jgi:DNA helicase HerA-like ATPase
LAEVGDIDKPKLVFFFDEAHLLFNDASKDFLAAITQTVRLIRSKGSESSSLRRRTRTCRPMSSPSSGTACSMHCERYAAGCASR